MKRAAVCRGIGRTILALAVVATLVMTTACAEEPQAESGPGESTETAEATATPVPRDDTLPPNPVPGYVDELSEYSREDSGRSTEAYTSRIVHDRGYGLAADAFGINAPPETPPGFVGDWGEPTRPSAIGLTAGGDLIVCDPAKRRQLIIGVDGYYVSEIEMAHVGSDVAAADGYLAFIDGEEMVVFEGSRESARVPARGTGYEVSISDEVVWVQDYEDGDRTSTLAVDLSGAGREGERRWGVAMGGRFLAPYAAKGGVIVEIEDDRRCRALARCGMPNQGIAIAGFDGRGALYVLLDFVDGQDVRTECLKFFDGELVTAFPVKAMTPVSAHRAVVAPDGTVYTLYVTLETVEVWAYEPADA